MKHLLKSFVIMALIVPSHHMFSQTKAEVVAAFNKGAELLKTDTVAAIAAFEESVAVSEKAGAEGDSLKAIAVKIIPALSFDYASSLVKSKKYDAAIVKYMETIKLSEKYGDSANAEKAKNNLPQLYYAMGLEAYNQKNDAVAVSNLEKALQYDPKSSKALYLIAVVYQRIPNEAKFIESVDKAIEVAKVSNDKSSEDKVINLVKAYYTKSFNNNIKANKTKDAIEDIKVALKYVPEDKNLLYSLGVSYNKAAQYDLALENLNKSLALETGSAEEKAKYYYEIGNALAAKKDNAGACAAYKNAQFGKYTENAKYQITTVLKCK